MQTDLIKLSGSPREMGLQHGRALKDEIHFLAKERYELAVSHAATHGISVNREQALRLARELLPLHEKYSPEVHAEFKGIAEGAQISEEDLLIGNSLTDFRDTLWQTAPTPPGVPGCTSFGIARSRSASGKVLIGQTWDMHATAQGVVHVFQRNPQRGPRSLTLSTSGCLSLIGINDAGIAIGNNNLVPKDARQGVTYLAMIHEALRQTDFGRACAAITQAPRASGHNYYLASNKGAIVNIETTATQHDEVQIRNSYFAHTNHYVSEKLLPLANAAPLPSTLHRLKRITQLLETHQPALDPEKLRQLFSDTDGFPDTCICCDRNANDTRSCAFVVLSPETGEMWATIGPPNSGPLTRYSL